MSSESMTKAAHSQRGQTPLAAEWPKGSDPTGHSPYREPQGWRSQFSNPRGFRGRLAGWLMARKNAAMNEKCVEWLAPAPADRVLEIGFGHGRTLGWIAERAPSGLVAGVDPSDEMLRMAGRRNRAAIQSGLVKLALGSAESLPFADGRFDKALAANCVQFWDLPRALPELRRVLRPGGVLLLGIRMREAKPSRLASPGFSEVQVEALRAPLERAGFVLREERARVGGRELCGLFAARG